MQMYKCGQIPGDGFSFMKLVFKDMAGDSTDDYVPPHLEVEPPPRTSWLRKTCTFFYMLFKAPRSFYFQLSFMDSNPLHGPELVMTGEKYHNWSPPVDIEWLKELKTRLGCGLNSVLLNTMTSSLRRYMLEKRVSFLKC